MFSRRWVQIEALIEYVDLFQQGDATVQARKEILIEQRSQLKERIAQMEASLKRLNAKIEKYEDMRRVEEHLRSMGTKHTEER